MPAGRRASRHRAWARLSLEPLEGRVLPAGDLLCPATPPDEVPCCVSSGTLPDPSCPHLTVPNGVIDDVLPASPIRWYHLDVSEAGVLTATLAPGDDSGVGLRLSLTRADGRLLVTSEGSADDPLGAALDQHLLPGCYYLGVAGQAPGAGYHLVTRLTIASSPLVPLPGGDDPRAIVEGDLDEDGHLDLIHADRDSLRILIGNGDGTFAPARSLSGFADPAALLLADHDRDGHLDLVSANRGANSLSVLLGSGDGTFASRTDVPVGPGPSSVAVGDLDQDGNLDLVAGNQGTSANPGFTLSVLRGNGSGAFSLHRTLTSRLEPVSVVLADVTGDGLLDVLSASRQQARVSLFVGNGLGSFAPRRDLVVGNEPTSLQVADIDADGMNDLLCSNRLDDTVSILLGTGGGAFLAQRLVPVGVEPSSIAVADLDRDGRPDLVCTSAGETLDVFLGNGDGTFAPRSSFAAGSDARAVRVGDLDDDGLLDLVCASGDDDQLFVLLGNGNGTFLAQPRFLVGAEPLSVAVADLDGDGRLDLVSADGGVDTLSVRLGNGDGTFRPRQSFATGDRPVSVAVGDLNDDGRPDLVAANRASNTLSILLGNGDGSFQQRRDQPVGAGPQAVLVTDLDGDGRLDLISANSQGNSLTLWLGNGDGTFGSRIDLAVGATPFGVAVADLDGNGRRDLVSANRDGGTLTVLLAQGDGSFARTDVPVGSGPVAVTVADLDGDEDLDLLSANLADTVSVLLGDGAGGFTLVANVPTGGNPFALQVADLDGDGLLDVVSADNDDGTLSVLLGLGNGVFGDRLILPTGQGPIWVVVADFNDDDRPDLVSANSRDASLRIHLGNPAATNGLFTASSPLDEIAPRHTPLLLDLDADGRLDTVTLDRAGTILYRRGLPDDPLAFAAPLPLNVGQPARDIAAIRTDAGWAVAAIDLVPAHSTSGAIVYTISRYTLAGRTEMLVTPMLPMRLHTGDLDGSGRDALVVAHSLDSKVSIVLPGGLPIVRDTGVNPSEMTLTDLDGDGLRDVLVLASVGADVTTLHNDAPHGFTRVSRFRAGVRSSGVDPEGTQTIRSLEQAVGLVVGDFVAGGRDDVTVLLRGTQELVVLEANGRGGLSNPRPDRITEARRDRIFGDAPGPMLSADFDRDGRPDLALLQRDLGEVWIFRALADGRFTFHFALAVGSTPGGLALFPNPTTMQMDLLVGNSFGDVLRLEGRGDGTFLPPPLFTGDRTTLSVLDASAARPLVLVANQQANRLTVQTTSEDPNRFVPVNSLPSPARSQAPAGPVAVRLDTDIFLDVVVVGSASNTVLVYRGTGTGTFADPVSFPVGTNPVAATVADLDADGILDVLVANKGSNDVSVLLGRLDALGRWAAVAGPRLHSGGVGPLGTIVRDLDGDGWLDVLVTNSQDFAGSSTGNLAVLPGRGQGFFDDRAPRNVVIDTPVASPLILDPGPGRVDPIGILTTASGTLVGVNLAGLLSQGTLFTPDLGRVQAVSALGDGDLVVALDDGSVDLLDRLPSGLYESDESLEARTGIPSDPSALEVLRTDSGLRVLVASAGSDDLFVFDLPPSRGIKLPGLQSDPEPAAAPASLEGASLAVVITLVAGGLVEDVAEANEANGGVPANIRLAEGRPGFQVGGNNEEGAEEVEEAANEEVVGPASDLEGELRALRLTPVEKAEEEVRLPDEVFAEAMAQQKDGEPGAAEQRGMDPDPTPERTAGHERRGSLVRGQDEEDSPDTMTPVWRSFEEDRPHPLVWLALLALSTWTAQVASLGGFPCPLRRRERCCSPSPCSCPSPCSQSPTTGPRSSPSIARPTS